MSVPRVPPAREGTTTVLVVLLVVVSVLAGLATVLVPGLLTGPPAMIGSARGTALVVVLGGAPVLALTYRRARSGSLEALALAAGAAAYLLYNAVLLVLATPFNRAFALYEVMLGLGIWTVASLVRDVWVRGAQLDVTPARWPAGFILGLVVLNGAVWLSGVLPALVARDPGSMLAGTGLTTNPVYVQDLAFWLPAFAWIAVGLWRGDGSRTPLGASVLCYWVLESASVAVDQWWGHHADPSSTVVSVSAVPLFVVVGTLTLWPMVSVLRTVGDAAPRPDRRARGTSSVEPLAEVGARASTDESRSRQRWTLPPTYVGWFFLWTSGIHVGIVAADPGLYTRFAEGALVPGLSSTWSATYMAHPAVAGLCVAAGEATLALLLLVGSMRWRRVGWIGTITFHVVLMGFGWGFWLWSVPALLLLVRAARADWRPTGGPWSGRPRTLVGSAR